MTDADQKLHDLAIRYLAAIIRYVQNGAADAEDENVMNRVEDLVPGVGTMKCTVFQWRKKVISSFGKLPNKPIQVGNIVLVDNWPEIMPELAKALTTINQKYRTLDEEWKA
jgi:hypothetical protein